MYVCMDVCLYVYVGMFQEAADWKTTNYNWGNPQIK